MPYPRRSRMCDDYTQASTMPKRRKRKGGLSHTQEPSASYNYSLFVYCDLPCKLHAHMVARSVTLTSPGQPGLSFARACMTSQCITSWGLSSNGITSLCPTSWHMLSTRRDLPEGRVCPLVHIILYYITLFYGFNIRNMKPYENVNLKTI